MFFGKRYDIMLQLVQEAVIGLDDLKVDGNTLLDGGVVKALYNSLSVLGFGNTSEEIG